MNNSSNKVNFAANNLVPAVLVGFSGRMAQSNIKAILKHSNFLLCGVLEKNDAITKLSQAENFTDLSKGLSAEKTASIAKIPVETNLNALVAKIERKQKISQLTFIDFSLPSVTINHLKVCQQLSIKYSWVIGTTGFSTQQENAIAAIAKKIPIVKAGNFSIGINLLLTLCKQTSQIMQEADIEILETHHKAKIDAPSGTALMLASAIQNKSRKQNLKRFSTKKPRSKNEIGFASLRGGGVIGEHEVQFLGEDESIFLRHRAENRALFTNGALYAALWVSRQTIPGLYSMADVLAAYTKN